jgi:hypothetical protein
MSPIETAKTTLADPLAAPPPQRDTPFGTITPRPPLWPGEGDRAGTRAREVTA